MKERDRSPSWRRAALAALALGLALWAARAGWRSQVCPGACEAADIEASGLLDGGDPAGALAAIDATDARCDCGRFTEGDEPPLHALAVLCLKVLDGQGQAAQGRAALQAARGPTLQSLRPAWGEGRPPGVN